MCGIYACVYNGKKPFEEYKHHVLAKRGPDDHRSFSKEGVAHAAFYRLAIVDNHARSMQPFSLDDLLLCCNGEIYNHAKLKTEYDLKDYAGISDCEVILHMYKLYGIEKTVQELDGEFAFVLIDSARGVAHFARDVMGVKPLYMSMSGFKDDEKVNVLEVSSLISAMNVQGNAIHVKPRNIYTYDWKAGDLCVQSYYNLYYTPEHPSFDDSLKNIYLRLKAAVVKRIKQADRPIGFLLSGGLDSSLVLSIAMQTGLLKTPPMVFTFGFSHEAPDVKSARVMVDWIKRKYGDNSIDWHLVIGSLSDAILAIPPVIQCLETYDTTTIRASVPMYLVSAYVAEKTNVKVLISGEGSDELFGGYLYFKYAPNDTSFRNEIMNLLNNIFLYDGLRADRSTAAHGLEVRPPFLDFELIEEVLSSPYLVRGSENTKQLLRMAVEERDLLPPFILNGKKEAFSDAVGLQWKDAIAREADKQQAAGLFANLVGSPHIKPTTNEEKMFQTYFQTYFGNAWHLLPKLWLPNQTWVKTGTEPSARVLDVYNETVDLT